ncbi:hypothetical protein GcM3_200012 [Golovinomyces cichoracearum]|uniref:Uncharacterized protein n=1 Tax=Golovinomyces cichoracearum TaxID=62708 RepID=A0A420HE09_9PEZI|nr:hypothetical protein GcM3_200012 [Golovinomyces cichoracearum]
MLSKTPVAAALRDENAIEQIGGKLVKCNGNENLATFKRKNATFEKNAFITPMGPRNRAPLGIKTTNANINAFRTPVGSQSQENPKTNKPKSIYTRQPTKSVYTDKVKSEPSISEVSTSEPDVEYCPPTPKNLPYESETFPLDCLNYSHVQSSNIMRDLYKTNKILQLEERGLSKLDKEQEEAYQRDARLADEKFLKMMKEEWTIGDVPEISSNLQKSNTCSQKVKPEIIDTKKSIETERRIPTLTSKKACRALSATSKSALSQSKKSKLPCKSTMALSRIKPSSTQQASSYNTAKLYTKSTATSRSTIGYSKGRDIPKILRGPMQRERMNAKQIYPSETKSEQSLNFERSSTNHEYQNPKFLNIFDKDGEPEFELCGQIPDSSKEGEEDEVFIMTLS